MSAVAAVDMRQVRRHFDLHAGEYDGYAVVQKRVVERLVELVGDCGGGEGPVLEIGSGTGWLSRLLPSLFPMRMIVLTDLAHGMTFAASSRTPGSFAADADAQSLPFISNRFDAILSTSVYQWINDLPRAFGENHRVTRSGGWFGFALFGERTLFELRQSHRRALEASGKAEVSHAQQFYSETEVGDALQAAGYETLWLRSEDEVEWHADVRALLHSLKRIGAQNASLARSGGLAARKVMTDMIRLYGQSYGAPQGIPATYQVIYGLARKPF